MNLRITFLAAAVGIAISADPAVAKTLRSKDVRVLRLGDRDMEQITVDPGGTIVSFPVKPSKVIIGREKQFDAQYVENDVALVALVPTAEANMYVYLLGRRYSFNIKASTRSGDKIVVIRDRREPADTVEVQAHDGR